MPPIVPRLNITLLDGSIGTDLEELNLSIENVLINGIEPYVEDYLYSVKNHELEELFKAAKDSLLSNYQLIEDKIDKGLAPLFNKNRDIILGQIDFMRQKSDESLHNKHDVILNKYKRVENKLLPMNSPQERILNPLPFINTYGLSFFAQLIHLPYEFDGLHKVIKI